MNRFSIIRNLVVVGTLALVGCFGQGAGSDDLSQTDKDPRHAELVGVEGTATPTMVAHSERNLSISGTTPLGGANMGPQPEPWTGANNDPNGGPQPEPWKPRRSASDPSDNEGSSAAAPK